MTAAAASTVPVAAEKKIAEGCWTAASTFFFQTQHGEKANRRTDDGIGMGWTIIGRPNFWGQYTHGNLGYGRCVSTYYVNDKFAIDYPLNNGDVVFSLFKSVTVTFAGRNNSHKNFGIFVVIKGDNGGKYVSMSAHLTALASGIKRGARVTDANVIGFGRQHGGSKHPGRRGAPAPGLLPLPEVPRGRLPLRGRGAAGGLPPLRRHRGRHRPRCLQVRLGAQLVDQVQGRLHQQLRYL